MNADEVLKSPPIERLSEAISAEKVRDFVSATVTAHCDGVPLTFPTVFRATEFDWLTHLDVDMHQLLHTEQEYEYLAPIRVGDRIRASTRVVEYRERRGLLFVKLRSEMHAGDVLAVRSLSSFVVRQNTKGSDK